MVFWIILGILVLLIVLILLIKVGIDLRYENDIVRFSLKVAWMKLQLLPKKKKEPKEEKPKKEKKPKEEKPKEEKPKEEKEKKPFPLNLEEIIDLLKAAVGGLGSVSRKVAVDRFVLHWICPGSWDPYYMSWFFGVVNAILSSLAPMCIERYQCRDSSVWTDIDYAREDMKFEFCLVMTIRIGQVLGAGLKTAVAIIDILLRSRRRRKREARQEKKALEKWLEEHPEDRVRLELQKQEEQRQKDEQKRLEEQKKQEAQQQQEQQEQQQDQPEVPRSA